MVHWYLSLSQKYHVTVPQDIHYQLYLIIVTVLAFPGSKRSGRKFMLARVTIFHVIFGFLFDLLL